MRRRGLRIETETRTAHSLKQKLGDWYLLNVTGIKVCAAAVGMHHLDGSCLPALIGMILNLQRRRHEQLDELNALVRDGEQQTPPRSIFLQNECDASLAALRRLVEHKTGNPRFRKTVESRMPLHSRLTQT